MRTGAIDWGALTHVCFRSVELLPDGGIKETRPREEVARLAAEAHRHGVKVAVLAWGTNAANGAKYLARCPGLTAKSLLDYVRACGLDGVNIDDETWETVNAETGKPNRELVTWFFRALRKTFKSVRKDYHLSWAAPPVISARDRYGAAWPDYRAISAEVDAFAIMSYTMNPPTAGWTGGAVPVSGGGLVDGHPRDLATELSDYLAATGGRKDRLLVGLGNSRAGVEWDCRGDGPLSPIVGKPRALSPESARANAGTYGRRFDPAQMYPWYRHRSQNGWVQGWYEDGESIKAKLDFARRNKLAGVCVWALDGAAEPPETFALLREYAGLPKAAP